MKTFNFAKTAIRDYKRVGAIVQSSHYVARRVADELQGKKIIVEYGAGDGVISKEVLKKMPKDGLLLAFETNEKLFSELKKITDSRLLPINEDIRKIDLYLEKNKVKKVGAVFSGIPFSMMKKKDRRSIIEKTKDVLNEKGIFVVYQTSPLVLSILKNNFTEVDLGFEFKNIPPYFIMSARKEVKIKS